MSSFFKMLLALAILGSGVLLSGCATNGPKQSSIPWSQPASWEAQIPGMNQPGLGR